MDEEALRKAAFDCVPITFAGQNGIWKPKCFERIPLSIRAAFEGPYRTRTPLISLPAIRRGIYQAVRPVTIIRDNPEDRSCDVLIEPSCALGAEGHESIDLDTLEGESAPSIRRCVTRTALQRMHRTAFRSRVVAARREQCTLCRLVHRELLDAAHIIADADPLGHPVVPNGLCLCKIHHAAFDATLIGVSPDYTVRVRPSVREETDGPLLQHGLKNLDPLRKVPDSRLLRASLRLMAASSGPPRSDWRSIP